jgi:hypothetical protein
LLIGIANAGMGMRLHSAAPTTILIARAFMGHLLLVLFPKQARQPRTGVLDGRDFLDWPDLGSTLTHKKRPGSFLCQVPDSAPRAVPKQMTVTPNLGAARCRHLPDPDCNPRRLCLVAPSASVDVGLRQPFASRTGCSCCHRQYDAYQLRPTPAGVRIGPAASEECGDC